MTAPIQPRTFAVRDRWLRAVIASDLPHVAARVAVRIALHLRVDTGQCNPSHKALADGARVSERSVYRWIDLLESAGWIEIERASGLANQYVLLTTATSVAGVTTATSMAGVDSPTPATFGNRPLPKRGGTTANRLADKKRNSEERKSEGKSQTPAAENFAAPEASKKAPGEAKGKRRKKSSVADADLDAEFAAFWAAYPRKKSKEAACRAFAKVRKAGVDLATLMAGIERYIAARIAKEPTDERARDEYTLYPAKWLHDGGWHDEPPPGSTPIIDEHGKTVAYEQPPQRQRDRGIVEIGEEMAQEYERSGNKWGWGDG
jgi:hypothetical protein